MPRPLNLSALERSKGLLASAATTTPTAGTQTSSVPPPLLWHRATATIRRPTHRIGQSKGLTRALFTVPRTPTVPFVLLHELVLTVPNNPRLSTCTDPQPWPIAGVCGVWAHILSRAGHALDSR